MAEYFVKAAPHIVALGLFGLVLCVCGITRSFAPLRAFLTSLAVGFGVFLLAVFFMSYDWATRGFLLALKAGCLLLFLILCFRFRHSTHRASLLVSAALFIGGLVLVGGAIYYAEGGNSMEWRLTRPISANGCVKLEKAYPVGCQRVIAYKVD